MSVRFLGLPLLLICSQARADDVDPLRLALEKQGQHKTVSVNVKQTKKVPALTDEIVLRVTSGWSRGRPFAGSWASRWCKARSMTAPGFT